MVRLVAGLSAFAGAVATVLELALLGKLPVQSLEQRHLREMKDRVAVPERIEPLTHAEFFALPRGLTVAEYSALERRAVALEGRVYAMLRALDGDFHLELIDADTPETGDPRYVTAEVTPQWRGALPRRGVDSPGWGYERLAAILRPNRATHVAWEGGPARVRISGWLLYDHEPESLDHLIGAPRVTRPTDWEIHPVTKIERWDDARAAWVEVAR